MISNGQLSLAKFLFITADDTNQLTTHNVQHFMEYLLERIDFTRDVHFYTNTTMDTLDYSGTGLNTGSKVVFAAYGEKKRELCKDVPQYLKELQKFENPQLAMPGVIALQTNKFTTYEAAHKEMEILDNQLATSNSQLSSVPLIIICDDSSFLAERIGNYLWAAS